MRKFLKISAIIFVLVILGVFSCQWYVESYGKYCFDKIEDVPHNKVGLVLGTSKFLSSGGINKYYEYRIKAAVKLFKNGKVDYLIVSGDNSRKEYNEPAMFKEDLIRNGVPANRIFLDYAGFRTLDSVVRCNKIFSQSSFTVVSQPFHNERAVFLARKKGFAAVGYNAQKVSKRYGLKTRLREYLARVNAVIDILLNTKPKFLGDKVTLE